MFWLLLNQELYRTKENGIAKCMDHHVRQTANALLLDGIFTLLARVFGSKNNVLDLVDGHIVYLMRH